MKAKIPRSGVDLNDLAHDPNFRAMDLEDQLDVLFKAQDKAKQDKTKREATR
jgi:hypothetical protein